MFIVSLVFISGIAGLVWAFYNYRELKSIECRSLSDKSDKGDEDEKLVVHYDPVSIGAIIK